MQSGFTASEIVKQYKYQVRFCHRGLTKIFEKISQIGLTKTLKRVAALTAGEI